jgi:hypothetical protein
MLVAKKLCEVSTRTTLEAAVNAYKEAEARVVAEIVRLKMNGLAPSMGSDEPALEPVSRIA